MSGASLPAGATATAAPSAFPGYKNKMSMSEYGASSLRPYPPSATIANDSAFASDSPFSNTAVRARC